MLDTSTEVLRWTRVSAIAASVTVAVYVVIGIVAWWQVVEARHLRTEQARPWVVVDFESCEMMSGLGVDLVIENIGTTAATDVTIVFDPPLTSTNEMFDSEMVPALVDGIPMLPPRKRLRYLFDFYSDRKNSELSMRFEVSVTYGDWQVAMRPGKHSGKIKHPWTARYVLDLRSLEGSLLPRKGLPEVVTTLSEIARNLETLRSVGDPITVSEPADPAIGSGNQLALHREPEQQHPH